MNTAEAKAVYVDLKLHFPKHKTANACLSLHIYQGFRLQSRQENQQYKRTPLVIIYFAIGYAKIPNADSLSLNYYIHLQKNRFMLLKTLIEQKGVIAYKLKVPTVFLIM